MKKSQNQYNEKKLQELILYIAMKSEQHTSFGSVKLNKLLFFSDFAFFAAHGRSITGTPYVKLERGPAPKRMKELKAEMETAKAAFERTEQLPGTGFEQKRLLALRKPDLSVFEAEEIALVDSLIERYRRHTGARLSEISHEFIGWKLAKLYEEIPYSVVCVPPEPLPLRSKELKWCEEVAARLQ